MTKLLLTILLLCSTLTSNFIVGYPTTADEYRFIDREYSSPGAHQLASWLASQLRTKEFIQPMETPIIPYRLPLGKRNSEVSNAIIGSEETQKMYRQGRK